MAISTSRIIPDRVISAKKATSAQPVSNPKQGIYVPAGASKAAIDKANAINKALQKAGKIPTPTPPTPAGKAPSGKTSSGKTSSGKTPSGGSSGSGGGSGSSGEAGTTPASSGELTLPLLQQLAVEEQEGQLKSSQALRKFQSDQAKRQLAEALGQINRAAIEGYKGISEDYAARGMQRSGSYMGAESRAMGETTRSKAAAQQALDDLIAQLELEDISQKESVARAKQRIMAEYVAGKLAGGTS